jgi:16S rRNA (cytosine1402-N4)-methyltransferase
MRFDPKQYFKAEDLVNTYTKSQLSEIFQKYGDFSPRFSEFIADAIISARKKKKIQTTFGLKQILKDIRLNERKISVIFQTIRIEVNQELKELEIFLQKFVDYLNLGGRVFIISYHSIEDRLVKTYLKQLAKENRLKIITKHVIKPDFEEIKKNRAARSAKLRIAEKI